MGASSRVIRSDRHLQDAGVNEVGKMSGNGTSLTAEVDSKAMQSHFAAIWRERNFELEIRRLCLHSCFPSRFQA